MNSFEGVCLPMKGFESNVHGSHSSSTTTTQARTEPAMWFAMGDYDRLDVATDDDEIHNHALYRLYHGHDKTDETKKVLIKILKAHKEFTTMGLLVLELRAPLKIGHDNILKAKGWSRDRENNYLVVHDHMPSGTLYSNLHSCGNLPWGIRFRVSCDLAEVILHIQQKGVLHRNITSNVVMLDQYYAAKLTSFVLAKFMEYGKEKIELIQIPELINNPDYIREGVVTPAFDVYSFGMVLLEIATGMNADDILDKLCNPSTWREIMEAEYQWLNDECKDQMERVLLAGLCCVLPPKQSQPPLEDIVDYLKGGRDKEIVLSFINAHSVDLGLVHIPESFDIGIPLDYPSNVPLADRHRSMIRVFLDDLHVKLSGKVTFEVIKKCIKSYTESLKVADAPLRDWNSFAQILLQRTKQIEHLWDRYKEEHQRLVEECTAVISNYRTELNDAKGNRLPVVDSINVSTTGIMLN